MKQFIEEEGCRRIILDREMDRRIDIRGCEMGEERCNVCSGAARGEKRRRILNDMAMGSGSIDEVEDSKESEVVE